MNVNLEIEQQVVGIELAIKLKRLGAKQDSYFVWHKGELIPRKDMPEDVDDNDVFAAFTSQELGWKLPKVAECDGIKIYLGMDKLNADMEVWYEKSDETTWKKDCYMGTSNEAYNRGYTLAILLENGAVYENGAPLG
jgi:hypothetical protein